MSIFLDLTQAEGQDLTPENVLLIFKSQVTALRTDMSKQLIQLFDFIWKNPKFSPHDLFAALGTDGASLFRFCTTLQNIQQEINPEWVWLSPDPKWDIAITEDGTVIVTEKAQG